MTFEEMKNNESECTESLHNNNEDSGVDTDSSQSSNGAEWVQQYCVFEKSTKVKSQLDTCHRCALYTFNISRFNIETISDRSFQYLSTCVRVLNISHNKLKTLPECTSELQNLEILDVSHNELQSVPVSLKMLKKIKILNLSYNHLNEVPECLQLGMPKLWHIDLSNNNILTFLKPPHCLPFLTVLNLSSNKFYSLPLWLFSEQCKSLVELDISFNFCFDNTRLPSQISAQRHYRTSSLKSLTKLSITNTGSKSSVFNCLSKFETLQCLHMGNAGGSTATFNYFWDISPSLFHNPLCLVELHLENVGLAGLPDDFCKFENLKVLNLVDNPLDWLPDTFGQLKNLDILNLCNCNISYLPENFSQLGSLTNLNLSQNKLTEIPISFNQLVSLQWLDLYDNCLEVFPLNKEFLTRSQLQGLDVGFNYFDLKNSEVLEESLLSTYYSLQSKLRDSNPKYSGRVTQPKKLSFSQTWSSLESLYNKNTSTDEESVAVLPPDDVDHDPVEEENWDEDSNFSSDQFDPNLVTRTYLVAGKQRFGWTPPVRFRKCIVPISLKLSGFAFIPSQTPARTSHHKTVKVHSLSAEEGQFDDCPDDSVGVFPVLQKPDTLWDYLKKKCVFVRNPRVPKVRTCAFCSIYEDCWHPGVWTKF